jgi:hypothetical protein
MGRTEFSIAVPTDRQRIQGYIKPDIYEKFAAFKDASGVGSVVK